MYLPSEAYYAVRYSPPSFFFNISDSRRAVMMLSALTFVINTVSPLPSRRLHYRPPTCCRTAPYARAAHTRQVKVRDGGTISVHVYDAISTSEPIPHEDKDVNSNDERVVLLIHDFMTDKRLFRRFVSQPSLHRYRFIAPDLRGFGASSAPRSEYSRTADLHDVLTALLSGDSSSTIDVMGSGMGGFVALSLALDYPSLVRSVTVLSSGLPGHSWSNDATLLDVTEARAAGRLLRAIPDRSLVSAAIESDVTDVVKWKRAFISSNATWNSILKSSTTDRVYETVIKELLVMARDYRGFHFFHQDPLVPDTFEDDPLINHIKQVVPPVLVAVGDADTLDFREIAFEIWDRLPSKNRQQLVRIPDTGHFLTLECPQVVAQKVSKFWSSV